MDAEQKALVIWLHEMGGLGGKMARHKMMSTISKHMPWVVWSFPEAAPRSVSYRGGTEMPAWFDMDKIPVTNNELHNGLKEAVADVHNMLRNAVELGFAPNRIVLCGFSQGGVLAMQSALTYDEPLAGVSAFAAWLPAGVLDSAMHPGMRFLWCSGDRDVVVPLSVAFQGAEALVDAGYPVRFCNYRGLQHSLGEMHIEDLLEFLLEIVPAGGPSISPLQGHCEDVCAEHVVEMKEDSPLFSEIAQ